MNNLYGMFRTRANIHQKACQHKTIKAVERMWVEAHHHYNHNDVPLNYYECRYIEAMDLVQDLKIVWAPVTSLRYYKKT